MNKIEAYNKTQSEKYGWTPEWFGVSGFGTELTEAIKKFQRDARVSVDGMCGPSTYRAIWLTRSADGDFHAPPNIQPGDKAIVHNGELVEIHWDKVVLWTDENGKSLDKYRSMAGQPDRKPNMFITHWDVCLSSSSCHSVLQKRGLSIHFGIDNDGTIHQWVDTQHTAYHAGSSKLNAASIGVEVSCAYDMKWQNWYQRKGFGERPVVQGAKVHGRTLQPFLGFYPVQLEALAALWEAVSRACGIPLALPSTQNGVDPMSKAGVFRGFANHYHLTERKIDCAGLDNQWVLKRAIELSRKSLG